MVGGAAKRIVRMQLGALNEHKIVRGIHRIDPRDLVVIGDAEKSVPLAHVTIQALLG